MKKRKINKALWIDIVLLALFFFAIELTFRIVSNYEILSWATLRILLSSILISILWETAYFIFKKRKSLLLWNCLLLFIVSFYSIMQIGFLNFIGIYMSLGTSTQIGAVKTYIVDFIVSLKPEYYLIAFPLIIYLFFTFGAKKKELPKDKPRTMISFFNIATLFIVTSCLYYASLVIPFMQNDLQLISNIELIHNTSNSSISVNQFGTTMFGILDVKSLLFPYQDHGVKTSEIEEKKDNSRKIDDTLWTKLIENTYDSTYQNLNQYFINRNISAKNEYTGYFKGKNIIYIMMESVNTAILNEEYFPNFAKMLKNGWYFENHFSPRNSCATINNEVAGITSIYPINNLCTANVYKDNTYFQSIFNQFKKAGYKVKSFHDYNEEYYERTVIHKNLGSDSFNDVDSLNYPYEPDNVYAWPSDADFMETILPLFINETPFFTWFTTVTAHQPYGSSCPLCDKYIDEFQDTDYTDNAKRYLSKVKVTDDALGVLLDGLKKADKLKDTVIVLYGDHYPYALSEEDLGSFMGSITLESYNRDRTPLLIYNEGLEPKTISSYTTYMNTAPTLANLFDLDYDPRLYFGDDVFDPDYMNRAIFSDGSWEDEKAWYTSATSNIVYKGEENYSLDEIKAINTDISNRIRMSNLAISSNYFHYLETGLEKEKETMEGDENE